MKLENAVTNLDINNRDSNNDNNNAYSSTHSLHIMKSHLKEDSTNSDK